MRSPALHRALPLIASIVALASSAPGCGGRRDTLWHPPEPCAVTVCMNGAAGDRHPGNQTINALCADLPGKIEDCADGPCASTFASFDGARVEQAFVQRAGDGRAIEPAVPADGDERVPLRRRTALAPEF